MITVSSAHTETHSSINTHQANIEAILNTSLPSFGPMITNIYFPSVDRIRPLSNGEYQVESERNNISTSQEILELERQKLRNSKFTNIPNLLIILPPKTKNIFCYYFFKS